MESVVLDQQAQLRAAKALKHCEPGQDNGLELEEGKNQCVGVFAAKAQGAQGGVRDRRRRDPLASASACHPRQS